MGKIVEEEKVVTGGEERERTKDNQGAHCKYISGPGAWVEGGLQFLGALHGGGTSMRTRERDDRVLAREDQ